MKFKFKFKGLKKTVKKIDKSVQKTLTAQEMKKLGDESIIMIRLRSRLGYGVRNKKRLKFPRLSKTYIEQRKRLKSKGKLDRTTSPTKSNITKTGQLLRSLKIIKLSKGQAVIGPSGVRKTSSLSNERLAEILTNSKNRPFLGLTVIEEKKLARFYQNKILKPNLAKV